MNDKEKRYQPRTIHGGRGIAGDDDPKEGRFEGRSAEIYFKMLDWNEEDFKDQVVLDLGAGPTARLERELEGVAKNVVSLSPDYANQEIIGWLDPKLKTAAGLAQELPYADESFDKIASVWTVPHFVDHINDLRQTVEEIYRVLKPCGEARISPILLLSERIPSAANQTNKQEMEKVYERVVDHVQQKLPEGTVSYISKSVYFLQVTKRT